MRFVRKCHQIPFSAEALKTAEILVESYYYCMISHANNNLQLKSVPVALSHYSPHYSAVFPFFLNTSSLHLSTLVCLCAVSSIWVPGDLSLAARLASPRRTWPLAVKRTLQVHAVTYKSWHS